MKLYTCMRIARTAALCAAIAGTLTTLVNAADGHIGFLAAQQLYAHQSTFKAHARVTGRGSQDVSYDVEARMPDAYHIKMQHGIEGIVRGSQFYMKAGNSWMRAPMSAPPIQLFPDARILGASNVREIEPDHFAFTAMGASACELWLSRQSHLPRTLQCRAAGSESHVDYYDWNAPVAFEVPQS